MAGPFKYISDTQRVIKIEGADLIAPLVAQAQTAADASDSSAADAQLAASSALAASRVAIPRGLIEGDSIMAQNHNPVFGSDFGSTEAKGELTWARALYPYFEIDQWGDPDDAAHYSQGCNVAVGGNNTSQVLARVDTVTDLAPDFFCLAIGINDINGGDTAADTMSNIVEIVRYYLGFGRPVLLGNIRPVGAAYPFTDWSNGSSRMAQRAALNDLIAAYAAETPGVHLVDLAAAYSNGATPPRPVAGDMEDELHPSPTGAFKGGMAWLAAIRKVVKPISKVRASSASIVSNSGLSGTGGTVGAGVTGVMADDWIISRNGSGAQASTAVASKDSDDRLVVTINPTGGAGWDMYQIAREFGGAALVAGRSYIATAILRISGSPFWRGMYFQGNELNMVAMGPSSHIFTSRIPSSSPQQIEMTSPVFRCDADQTGAVLFRIAIDPAGTDPMTVTIEGLLVQEVPDPKPLHGFLA